MLHKLTEYYKKVNARDFIGLAPFAMDTPLESLFKDKSISKHLSANHQAYKEMVKMVALFKFGGMLAHQRHSGVLFVLHSLLHLHTSHENQS